MVVRNVIKTMYYNNLVVWKMKMKKLIKLYITAPISQIKGMTERMMIRYLEQL